MTAVGVIPGTEPPQTKLSSIEHRGSNTLIAGFASKWEKHRGPISIEFSGGSWLERRSGPSFGFQTCFLHLPTLTGADSFDAIAMFHGKDTHFSTPPFPGSQGTEEVSGYEANGGSGSISTAIAIVTGSVSLTNSFPPPTYVTNYGANWSCSDNVTTFATRIRHPDLLPDVLEGPRGLTFPARGVPPTFIPGSTAGCQAVTIITDDGASTFRDFVLLVAGVLIGFGVGLVASGFRPRRRPVTPAAT